MATADFKQAIVNVLNGSFATTGYYGLSDLKNNTDELVQSIFDEPVYTQGTRDKLVKYFSESTIELRGEAPRRKAELPCVVLLRDSSSEDTAFVGDFLDYAEEQPDFINVEVQGARLFERMVVEAWGRRTTTRDAVYVAVRELLFRARPYFRSCGLKPVEMTAGDDGQMNLSEEKKPLTVHKGKMAWSAKSLITWEHRKNRLRNPELESWKTDSYQAH